jgi:hypothetical protein
MYAVREADRERSEPMAQTRMFRDRVVSMEQTLEGGEKHLAVLKDLCREALPELEFREYMLDHERDLFVMDFAAENGASRRICWTRMVLFDAERIPTLGGEAGAALRAKIVEYLRARAAQPEIVVTFRHLEEGWVDTPEPRREGRRRRRGGRGRGQAGQDRASLERRGVQPERRPGGGERRSGGGAPERRPGGPPSGRSQPQRTPQPQRSPQPPRPAAAEGGGPQAEPGAPGGAGAGGKRRRRFRRRRRGRGSGGGGGGSAPPSAPAP